MSEYMDIIIILAGVLAFIGLIVYASIYAIRLNKAVNEMKTPYGVEQIRRKSQWLAIIFLIITMILAYFFV